MTESKVFELNGISVRQVAETVESFLRNDKNMKVQSAPTQNGCLIQAAQDDTLKTLSGMKLATTVELSASDNRLNVTIGEGQWTDKLGAGAVGLFLLWPLAVTAGIGAYKQKKLPSEIFDVILHCTSPSGSTLYSQAQPTGSSWSSSPQGISCPKCNAKLPADAKFCNYCGAKITDNCPNCGAAVKPGSKFCPECGHSLT